MKYLSIKTLTYTVLVGLLSVVFLGFVIMAHESDGSMTGECPLSLLTGGTVCFQGVKEVVLEHISVYRSFFAVPTTIALDFLIASMLWATAMFFAMASEEFMWPRLHFLRYHSLPHKSQSRFRKLTAWLSLLENSPS